LWKAFRTEQHDHKQEKHHDRAGIHSDLRHGDEGRTKQQVKHRHRDKVQHQEQCRIHRIPAEQHAQGGTDRDQGKDEEEDKVKVHSG
jgi:hypothetical protein